MYSQTDWADWAEIFMIVKGVDCRTIQKILSRSDPYGQFYRPIKAENDNKNTYLLQLRELENVWNFLIRLWWPEFKTTSHMFDIKKRVPPRQGRIRVSNNEAIQKAELKI